MNQIDENACTQLCQMVEGRNAGRKVSPPPDPEPEIPTSQKFKCLVDVEVECSMSSLVAVPSCSSPLVHGIGAAFIEYFSDLLGKSLDSSEMLDSSIMAEGPVLTLEHHRQLDRRFCEDEVRTTLRDIGD
ncbi:hypothetical protein Dimus_000507 [Dionaea muscipula]